MTFKQHQCSISLAFCRTLAMKKVVYSITAYALLMLLAACSKPQHHEEAKTDDDRRSITNNSSQVVADEIAVWPEMRRSYELHAKLTVEEIACGLSSDPLDYNDKSAPELDVTVLRCLESIESYRAAWKAFLYSVDQFETNSDPCIAKSALSISLRSGRFAIISGYKITVKDIRPRVEPLVSHLPFLSLEQAKNQYLDGKPGFTKKYVEFLTLCDVGNGDQKKHLDMVVIRNFLNVDQRK